MADEFEVRHEPESSRYVLVASDAQDAVVGVELYVDVPADGGTHRVLFHTEVSRDHSGKGLASRLVEEAVTDAIGAGNSIVPVCPYVKGWLERHPEHAEHVVPPTPAHLDAIPPPPR